MAEILIPEKVGSLPTKKEVPMLTIGFILLVVAGILAIMGFGVVNSPAVGPVRVAFYFLLFLSLSILVYGMVQEEIHVDPRVPTQEQN